MNRAQVAALLAAAAAVDPEFPVLDDAGLATWAAQLTDVPMTAAVEALQDHYPRHSRPIVPADIVTHWQTTLPQPAERRGTVLVLPDARLPTDPRHRVQALSDLRTATATLARATGVPPLGPCTLRLRWTVPDGHRRDPDHVAATVMACADGLADAGVLGDLVDHGSELERGDAPTLVIELKPTR
ncbi:hypothetical protein ABZ816_08165 [Actinosynnema sp. NPDC047251]|uniref:Uncharacterized protein n=1 Tax=Saccharothrix espanaensis (strain ATCC 51144 / DSM 44229 / JCM 9112 / NBRC 15066 / NRRL 15764) TaxID=1179773 RepID=K0JPZ6_SACES|nr:hypothetical protein [Saccharothrix espanaensis]CCH27566.1 hypothetical protein BN6_02330 [Saccharothrix espanaensis DSM 44229]